MKITATSTNRNLISTTISIISTIHLLLLLPVVPHKAVAEVSKIGNL